MSGLNAMLLKKTTRIIRNKLYLSLAISLLTPIPFYLHAAEEPVAAAAEEEPIAPAAASVSDTATRDTAIPDQNLNKITVTGSRIPRAQAEGPSPVTVITGEEMKARGYRNVYDAIATQTQNTGMTQGEDYGNTWQPAANALNLRGLGPNHTLVLVNGRRLADYPNAYGGSVNFTNIANIPSVIIDRIEILSSGASAIYGSDAIAGVVNIILKEKAQGVDVNVRGGTTERGGGDNYQLQLSGGGTWDRFDGFFGLEATKRDPIWGSQRDFMNSYPDGSTVGYRRNLETGAYISPGCQGYGGLFGGNVTNRNGRCTTDQYYNNYWTVQSKKENYDGYLSGAYHLNDTAKVFANLLFGFDKTQTNTRGPSFTSPDFYNANTGNIERWARIFSPEEIGGRERNNSEWRETTWTGTLGFADKIGSSDWNYEVAYTRSQYTSDRSTRYTPLSGIKDFYLGPQLGEQDGYPVYAPDASRLDRPLTREEWARYSGVLKQKSKSESQTYSFTTNGELFNLPAGPVGFASVAEYGKQSYSVRPDRRLNDGTFYNTTPGSVSGGDRDRYALGAELSIPLTDTLLASTAGRWDQYKFSGRSEQDFTYNTGLEWRPVKSLLFRGNYSTSFRAPDLNYIYQADSNGYFSGQKDYYGCAQGIEGACDPNAVNYTQSGTSDLESEHGRSWSYGVVWSPSSNLDFSADFWRVQIKDLLTTVDANRLLQEEYQCRISGNTGSHCQEVLSRIIRNPATSAVDPNKLQRVRINAINAASERTSGLDFKANARWDANQWGDFSSSIGYSLVLSHFYKESDDAPTLDLRNDYTQSANWRSKINASLTWNINDFTSTVFVNRYGSVANAAGTGRLTPWAVVNASVRYKTTPQSSVGLTVNNVLDKVKKDESAGWPNYPTGNYDPYGRQWWLDFSYHFQ
ncbi:TonB-dependent receptor [Candidatus Symbiopectobacterium sp. NZEC127]|uniref:TonB-dependent receptor plug domain-containing protein n=4 Tax=unclassified Symbiopectobacterium TaxID=2794573 RepID=UPI002226C260|nr:TonB-dependent receptor [Candidatus Symbiopectobacterium sp. NZEC127]MCW2487481.1 TonB-dependent receptor [Candidatus Symbiopectobacterium sp. NZEC127]